MAAWGGDAERKQAAIGALRTGLAARPNVLYGVDLFLAAPESGGFSNVYCAAYGTADPGELEDRSGLPVWVLQLVSGVLEACVFSGAAGRQLVESAADVPLTALEAIPVGADLQSIMRRHIILMFDRCVELRDNDCRVLAPEQQTLVQEVRALHAAGSDNAAAFRALRRRVVAANDAANDSVQTIVLEFAESVAWPMAGLFAELPMIVNKVHLELCAKLAPERPTAEELAAVAAMWSAYQAIRDRQQAESGIDEGAVQERWRATPEYLKVNAPEFQARLHHYSRASVEAYSPLALGILFEALRSA